MIIVVVVDARLSSTMENLGLHAGGGGGGDGKAGGIGTFSNQASAPVQSIWKEARGSR